MGGIDQPAGVFKVIILPGGIASISFAYYIFFSIILLGGATIQVMFSALSAFCNPAPILDLLSYKSG